MIQLIESPFQLDPNCEQVSCHFDKDLYSAETPSQFKLDLPQRLESAVAKRKAEFIAGRYCAQQALEKTGVIQPPTIDISENRAPIWPPNIVGSITHTHGYASAVIASKNTVRSIGIDSEHWISEKTATNVAGQILGDGESYEQYESLFQAPEQFLTFVFSAKESIYKCLHPLVNKFFGFHSAKITVIEAAHPDLKGKFQFQLLEDLNGEFKKGFAGEGHYCFKNGFVHTAVLLN